MSRLLVTGGSGFVGGACLSRLSATWPDVHTCGRTPSPEVRPEVTFHRVDLLDAAATSALLEKVRPSHLLHLAWVTTPGHYWDAAENDDWLTASQRLLGAFADHGGRRAVVAGTCAEYDWTAAGPYREHGSPIRPAGRYGRAKDALRRWCDPHAPEIGITVGWCRLFFLYGPREHPDRFVPALTRTLLEGRSAPCPEGTELRDFLHVGDAAEALLATLESDVRGPVNVGSGVGVARSSVAGRIAAAVGRPDLLRVGRREAGTLDSHDVVADVARLRREVGWVPTRSLEEGISDTVDWWRSAAGGR